MTRSLCLVVLMASPSWTQPAAAQSPWQRQTMQSQERAARTLRSAGYQATGESHTLVLNTGERATFSLTLEGGVAYVLVGVCDEDCTGLQLALFAPNDYEVDAARAPTATPILRLTPRDPGSYRVQLVMAACRHNPCWSAVGVYRKR